MVEKWLKDFFSVYSIKMMDYVLRLQALDGYHLKFTDVFTDRFSRVLHVHHTGKKGDNPHYHFCISCDYKKDALRKYLKGHFDLGSGNKHISLKDWDGSIRACAYLYHEGTKVTSIRGFTEEELSDFQTINKDVKQNQVKIPVLLEKVVKRLTNMKVYGHTHNPSGHYIESHDEHRNIFNVILDECRKSNEFIPNRFQMERYINKVRMMMNPEPHNYRKFEADLYNEYFPKF